MQLITPSQQTVTTTYTGGGLDVGTPKNVSATIPLYLERSVTDTFAPQSTPATQSYTATSTFPKELVAGFLDKNTGKFYQEVSQPVATKPNTLVATIQQPAYNQPVTAPTAFKTVAYSPAPNVEPLPQSSAPAVVRSTPVVTPSPSASPSFVPAAPPVSDVVISDEVQEAVAIIKELMEKPAIQKMVATYQQEGARGLFHWSTVRRGLNLLSDRAVKQHISQLAQLLKSPDVQAAIRNPKAVLGNDDELNALLNTFNSLGLVKVEEEAPVKPSGAIKKKPAEVEAESASDAGEEPIPSEASPGTKDVPLDELIAELSGDEVDADPHAGHDHAQRSPKRHRHGKPSSTAAED